MPGSAGGWICVRDAVKKALPKDAADAGQVPRRERRNAEAAPAATEDRRRG